MKSLQGGGRTRLRQSFRLTGEERAQLAAAANGQTISAYVRARLFVPSDRPVGV